MESKPKCTPCEEAKLRRKKNESIQGGFRQTGSLEGKDNFYSGSGGGGDKPSGKFKKSCTFALALAICIPLLVCFAFIALVVTIAKIVPEITDYVLR